MYRDVRDPTGKLLFRYDAERSLVEIKSRGVGTVVIDLLQYEQQQPAPAAEQHAQTNQPHE